MTAPRYANCESRLEENGFMKRHAQSLLTENAVTSDRFLQDWTNLSNGSGIHCLGLDNDIYHAISDVLSATPIHRYISHGPRYFDQVRRGEVKPFSSGPLNRGAVIHESLEHGGCLKFLDNVAHVVSPECATAGGELSKTKKATDKIAEELEQAKRTIAITEQMARELLKIDKNIAENTAARDLMESAIGHEVSCIWKRPAGHYLRCRFDMITADGIGVDFKTTKESQILNDFWKSCISYNYALSCAIYREGGGICGVTDGGPLRYIVISTAEPFEVQVCEIPASMVDRESKRIGPVLDEIQYRTEHNDWLPPGYGTVVELPFPARFLEESYD